LILEWAFTLANPGPARSREGREISVAKAISFGHIGPRRAAAKFYEASGRLGVRV